MRMANRNRIFRHEVFEDIKAIGICNLKNRMDLHVIDAKICQWSINSTSWSQHLIAVAQRNYNDWNGESNDLHFLYVQSCFIHETFGIIVGNNRSKHKEAIADLVSRFKIDLPYEWECGICHWIDAFCFSCVLKRTYRTGRTVLWTKYYTSERYENNHLKPKWSKVDNLAFLWYSTLLQLC